MDRATRYETIIATLVGVSALAVSAYTAHVQRQQVRAQVYPILMLQPGWGDDDVHVTLSNKGSGPALIRDMRMSVDGKPIHNWIELIEQGSGNDLNGRTMSFSSVGQSVVAAGEQERVLSFGCRKPPAPPPSPPAPPPAPSGDASKRFQPSDPVCARLSAFIRKASLSVCYCSTLDDCLLLSDEPGRDPTTTEVRRCPKPSDDSFN